MRLLRFARNDNNRKPGRQFCLAKQTGYILLPVIVVITLVAAIALLMNTESALESNTAATELEAQQAQYVAEAGLNHALWMAQQQGCGPYSDLTDEPLGNDNYTTNLTTDLGSTTAFTINVDQDSWIRSDQPTVNKAVDLKLHTRNEVAGIERPLVRYDLSPIAAKASILSATAWFYITNAHAAGPIDIHLTSADWTETDATWDSMNANMGSTVLASIPSQPVTGIWIPVNLTAQVQAWVNGQSNFGITLNSTVDGVHGQYNSRESANPPYLEVIVGTPPTSPAVLKAVGTLANGVTRDITRNDATLVQHPASFVQWQHDAVLGVDAYIWEFNPTTNYGIDDETWVSRSTNNTSLSLFKFDVDKLLPGTRILNATLSLLHESGNNSNVPVSAHRIVSHWDEANVTWEKADTQDWDTQGGDLDERVVSTTLVGPTSNIRYEWDLTSLVQGWADNAYPNYGVALRTLQNGSIGERFYTSDETIETRRPRLTITYACTCGEVCVTPQGSGNVLMPVTSTSNPAPGELLRIALLESWGYVVDTTWQKNSQSNFNSAIAANDVVYVPVTVDPNEIDDKLTNAPIGVVIEEGELTEELGFSTGQTWKVGDSINIVDNSHYITQIFPSGTLPIYSANMEILTVSGTEAAGLTTLADIGGAGSLVVLDTGDATGGDINGATAAGRRVMLPLGRESNFNLDQLNNNGRLIVQRALAWGAGLNIAKTGPNLLLVVVNPSSLTSQESAKKTLIESWNYNVNLIDEADSQANFDAALAVNDVAYISGDVSDSTLGTKLTSTTLGVVNEQIALHDELGFSQSAETNDFTNIFVVDNSHSITDGFATGWLTIATSSQPLNALKGTVAPGLQNLAEVWISGANYDDGLAVLDTGAQLYGGGNAAGRRAQLPWGATGFDVNALNDNGKTIMQRAIEWASSGCASLQPLLLVVGDSATLSSKDAGMKSLMQSWCYAVTVIDDGASQASFDAAAAVADVVYVSGTTSGPSLQDKLTGSPTPIVNEINGKLDNFGFSSSTASSVTASAFSATSASHYISEPFAGGPVTFFSTDLAMPVPGGTLAPDLQTVGETSGAIPALVTLDSGAQRWDATPAPARRVHLPFTNAETSQLTADGETLLQRTLEWATGSNKGPIAHWKFDETSGTTAVDSVGGYDGTLINWPATPDWVPGVLDGGLSFDGSNDYIDVSSMNPLSYDDFTIIAWYKSADTSVSDDEYIFVHDDSFVDEFTFGPTDDGGNGDRLRLGLNRGGSWDPHYGTSDIVDQQWHHLVAVRAGGRIKLYVDGVLETDNADAHAGLTVTIDGDGPFIGDYPGVTEQVHGTLDDVRFYDRGLSDTEIADLYSASAPVAPGYTELYQPWSATVDNAWETVDLAPFGVPPDAVVEVAMVNAKDKNERWGGVRAVGSSLDRRLRLHEAEGGGVDALTMHVQADSTSQIQHYSERKGELTFILLGYWTGASYTELMEPFSADSSNSWVEENLADDGLGPNQVAEIVMLNTDTGNERLAGVRPSGATFQRRFNLHEAENGGIDAVTMMVNTDASSIAEVFASNAADVDFYVVGYWSTPPGTYTETGGVHGQASAASTWEQADLTAFGVPADSVAQFVVSSEVPNFERRLGVRELGSTNNRTIELQEAEEGGSDNASMHVNVDSSARIEWYSASGTSDRYFYPVGWWMLSP